MPYVWNYFKLNDDIDGIVKLKMIAQRLLPLLFLDVMKTVLSFHPLKT